MYHNNIFVSISSTSALCLSVHDDDDDDDDYSNIYRHLSLCIREKLRMYATHYHTDSTRALSQVRQQKQQYTHNDTLR